MKKVRRTTKTAARCEDDSSEEENGWWTNTPTDNALPLKMQQQLVASDDEDSLFDYGDDDHRCGSGTSGLKRSDRSNSESMVNLLEREIENGFDSPLLTDRTWIPRPNVSRLV